MGGRVPKTWTERATHGDASAAVSFITTQKQPGATEKQIQTWTRLVDRRGYSRAELLLAMHEVPFRNDYGQGFRLDVLDEVIQENRRDRERLGRLVTEQEMYELVERYPSIAKADFHLAGFGEGYERRREKQFRYAPHIEREKRRPEPTPMLDEKTPRDRDASESTGLTIIRGVIEQLNQPKETPTQS